MTSTQVREINPTLSEIDPELVAAEPSHIHIPRPSRVAQAAAVTFPEDGDELARIQLLPSEAEEAA